MTDLTTMLLSRLSTAPLQPVGLSLDNERDISLTFQSSLEALVEAVADDDLEVEIQAPQEPIHADGMAALMMMIIAPPSWNPIQAPTANASTEPPPSGGRNPAAHIVTHPSIPGSTDTPVPDEADVPASQQAPNPLLSDTQDAKDMEVRSADIEMKATPVASTAVPAVRTDRPAEEPGPPHLPPRIQPHEAPWEDQNQQNAIAPTEYQAMPPRQIRHPHAAGTHDAMFLPSQRLVVRNPVPHATKSEQTAFEVQLTDEAGKGLQLEEPGGIPSPQLVQESRDTDDRSDSERSESALQGVTQAASDSSGYTKSPQPEAPKTNGLMPSVNSPSSAKESAPPVEKDSPPQRQPSSPAALEHKLDKPKPFQASTGLQLRVGPREEVSIHVNQIAGNVRISVRSVDADLTRELQAGVPNLLAALTETGVHAEATIPDIGSPIAQGKESTISNIASGSSGWSQENSSDTNGDSSGQNRRHRRQEHQWKEWLEER